MSKTATVLALLFVSARFAAAQDAIRYDFGRVLDGTVVTHEFAVTNTGAKGQAIAAISTSCGCLKAGGWKGELPPGKAGLVKVSFDSSHAGIGPLVRAVTLSFAGQQATQMLLLQGEVWPAMDCEPKLLRLAPSPGNDGILGELSLSNHLGMPVEVLSVAADSPGLSVSLQTNLPGRSYRVTVSARGEPQGRPAVGRILIRTSSTNSPVIPVTLYLPRTEQP